MKIAFVIYSLQGGGAERVTSYLANYWSENNYEVVIYTFANASSNDYPLNSNVRRVNLIPNQNERKRSHSLFGSVRRIRLLRQALLKSSPDYLISMMTKASVIATLACYQTNTKCICAERNDPSVAYAGTIWYYLRKISYKLSDTVVVQSEKSRLWIKTNTWAKNVIVIPNPVKFPIRNGEPRLPVDLPKNACVILAVGRLSIQKQFNQLLIAFAKIKNVNDNLLLVILGEGAERPQLEKLRTELSLSDSVLMPGRAGNISDWYQRANMLVMSSGYEGFPNVLIEALSYGVPVISYDCDTGPRDIIDHGINGLLVEPNNVNDLTSAIATLINDEALRSAFIKSAPTVKQTFNIEAISAQWQNIFV